MRLFIAVPLPKDVQRAVYTAEEGLRVLSTAGRFVPAGNFHITLRFLGETNALADIAAAMHEAVKDARPFLLRLGTLGSFTHGGARTSYLSVTGDLDELFRIRETLEAALFEYGFAGGKVRFSPHIFQRSVFRTRRSPCVRSCSLKAPTKTGAWSIRPCTRNRFKEGQWRL